MNEKRGLAHPIEINGKYYPTMSSAAEALGISISAMSRRVSRAKREHKPLNTQTNCHHNQLTINGVTYRNKGEIERAFKVKYAAFIKRLEVSTDPNYLRYGERLKRMIKYKGEYYSITDFAKKLGVSDSTIKYRIRKYGLRSPKVTAEPNVVLRTVPKIGKKVVFNGQQFDSHYQFCKFYQAKAGLPYSTISNWFRTYDKNPNKWPKKILNKLQID